MTVRLAAGLAAARAVGGLARATGRGGGTSLPGKVLTRVEPHAIERLAGRLARGSVVISATNGKTTTAAMVSTVLERAGTRLVHNRAGANMVGGVASALAAAARRGGRVLDGDLGLFEVDEFWLGPVVEELEPRAILLSNLFRDQLDRYGELDIIADRWAELVARHDARSALVLNADDPLVADLGRGGDPARPDRALYFGVEDDALALPELQHASDSKHCRRCGHAYVYETVYLAHLGRYHCPNCGRRRPEPAVVARDVELRGIRSAAFTLSHEGEDRARRAAAARPLQRLQRARRGGAVPRARGPAGRRRRRPGRRRARVRARRDDRPRRAPDVDPARQEPGGRQRGAADAHARGPRARRLRRAQRPHRRRPRRLVGVGRRLGGARPPRAAHDLLGHARRRAGAADEVRGRGPRPAASSSRGSRRASTPRSPTGDGPLYALPTYTALLELRELLARRGQAREYWR